MSVLIETSLGDIVADLYLDQAPIASRNFLKLCKIHAYDGCLFFRVVKGFLAQTGDPTGTGRGGSSVVHRGGSASDVGVMPPQRQFFFDDEHAPKHPSHDIVGTLGMSHTHGGKNENGSQFYITLRSGLGDQLDSKFTAFGHIVEDDAGKVLNSLNDLHVDDKDRPLEDIRVLRTHVLDDPFPDPQNLAQGPFPEPKYLGCPPDAESAVRTGVYPRKSVLQKQREREYLEWTAPEIAKRRQIREAREAEAALSHTAKLAQGSAKTLEILGDIYDADAAPPENVLFVCKLNKVTDGESLELIFSRFGNIKSCNIVCDPKTGASLQYAFIEFESKDSCEEAFVKMNNVLIDDRRIKVDFSQSVAKQWNKYKGTVRAKRNHGHTRQNTTNHTVVTQDVDLSSSMSARTDQKCDSSELRSNQGSLFPFSEKDKSVPSTTSSVVPSSARDSTVYSSRIQMKSEKVKLNSQDSQPHERTRNPDAIKRTSEDRSFHGDRKRPLGEDHASNRDRHKHRHTHRNRDRYGNGGRHRDKLDKYRHKHRNNEHRHKESDRHSRRDRERHRDQDREHGRSGGLYAHRRRDDRRDHHRSSKRSRRRSRSRSRS